MSTGNRDRRSSSIPHEAMSGPGRGHAARFAPQTRAEKPRHTIRRIAAYLGPHGRNLVLVASLVVVGTGIQMAIPYLQGWAIDNAIIPGDLQLLARIAVGLAVAAFCLGGLTWAQQWIMIGVSQTMIRDLRKDLYDDMMELSLRYFDTNAHGDLMSRVTNDIDTISTVLTQAVPQVVASSLMIVGITVAMIVINWQLAIVALLAVPAISLISRVIAKRTRSGFKDQQRHLGLLNGLIEESVAGIRVLKLFRREPDSLRKFEARNDELRGAAIRAQIMAGLMGPVMNMVRNVNFAVVAFAGGIFAVHGWATVGTIAIVLQYTRQFSRPINEIATLYNTIQSAIAGAERVFSVIDEKPDIQDEPDAQPLVVREGRVQIDDVSFGYLPDQPVLRDVTFGAKPGSTVALVGPTGAGKTTIVNLLTRFYDVDRGAIRIDGRDTREVTTTSLRRAIGIVLQDTFLFGDTVRENIRYGRLDATDEEVEQAARLANADHFIRHLPKEYDTHLSEDGANLSQGQRQLVSIARAVLAEPAILVLDEATSSVDTRTEVHIQDAMEKLMAGRTSFVIAHRLNTIREADVIVVIEGGRIVESGSHDELVAAGGAYARLYESQFRVAG